METNIKINNNDPEYMYDYIARHAFDRKLSNTLSALLLVRDMVIDLTINKNAYQHCLMVCRMMIDLNIDITLAEEDIMLAASLCHVIPKYVLGDDPAKLLVSQHHLDIQVAEIISLLNEKDSTPEHKYTEYFERIQKNKLALLIAITDRGNDVERLHVMSTWEVRRFIYNTRRYYFSLCIYAKEYYHELLSPVGILLEKLRNLTDVSEILLVKFENMEIELTQEILSLKEENATIKGIMQKLKNS